MSELYKAPDGFTIEKVLGNVEYYVSIIRNAIKRYGLVDNPNYRELNSIGEKIKNFITTKEFDNALGTPAYARTDFMYDVRRLAKSLSEINEKELKTAEESKELFDKILRELYDAEMTYSWDSQTR